VLCPPRLAGAIAAEKRFEDRAAPVLDQLALAALIESGRYDRHLRRMRGVYAAKRRALMTALARHAPGLELRGLAAGFHALVLLPAGLEEDQVVAAARERSLGVYGLRDNTFGPGRRRPALVMGFGNLGEGAIERGIETLAEVLKTAARETFSGLARHHR
jgi:GntR family transcriptional regulator/MocR family aminotransferase